MKLFLLLNILWLNHCLSAVLYRVDHYVARSQSPFAEGIASGSIYFNNFETPTTSFPNLTLGMRHSFVGTVSIDEDDGTIDGIGFGTTLRSRTINGPPNFIFNFTPDAEGHYPRYFGIAFPTDVSDPLTGGFLHQEIIGVKDPFGSVVLSGHVFPTPAGPYNRNSSLWGTFFGIYNENGISQVTLTNADWVDHLQYGYSIPEPRWLWIPALVLAAGHRRRQGCAVAPKNNDCSEIHYRIEASLN